MRGLQIRCRANASRPQGAKSLAGGTTRTGVIRSFEEAKQGIGPQCLPFERHAGVEKSPGSGWSFFGLVTNGDHGAVDTGVQERHRSGVAQCRG